MILVDANLLLYAENASLPQYEAAHTWWDEQLSGSAPVCLSWAVIGAFIRIGTNPRVFPRPLTIAGATERVQSWLEQTCVRLVLPTDRHWTIFQKMLNDGQATANLVSDAHLATLALEHGCTLMSTDADFARFPGLRWRNPLKQA